MRHVLSFLAASLLALTVHAQADNADRNRPGARAGPGMGMKDGPMGMTNMPDDMKQRSRMMMQTAINPADPAAILALKEELKLTPEQFGKLHAIQEKARQEAKAVLDERQVRTLEAIPVQPDTPMAMHQHMMQMMQQMQQMQGKQDGGGQMPMMMNCPMMNMMGDGKAGATTRPARETTTRPARDTSDSDHEAHH